MTKKTLLSALAVCCMLAASCTRQDPERYLTAYPGQPGGSVDLTAGASFIYSGEDGVYTISLCNCGKYASSTPNPWFEAGETDAASPSHYRFLFGTGEGAGTRLWFFNIGAQ